ncbi:ras association domain-containing protein 8 [Haematobia irritans]|uniref:ras association domain-containing protein 8 n=1 Tax=Haematobia irritans TaxID=7368 RepID=UPI003F4F4E45
MELKVWVEGIQRIVCGVTVNTTCQDVVFALAHATGKVGRFTLIERWRNNERLLAPNENPLKLLLKWGEYANDVQFILQRSESKQQQNQQQNPQTPQSKAEILQNNSNNNSGGGIINNSNNNNNTNNNESTTVMLNKKPMGLSNITNNTNIIDKQNNNNNTNNSIVENALNATVVTNANTTQHQKHLTMELSLNAAHERAKELKKSFGVHESKPFDNIGIVKGIPQRNPNGNNSQAVTNSSSSTTTLIPRHEKSHSNPIEMPSSMSGGTVSSNGKGGAAYAPEHNHSNNNNRNTSNNIYQQLGAHNSKSINEINLAEVRNALDKRTAAAALANNTSNMNSGIEPMSGSAEMIFTSASMNNHGNQQQMSMGSNENLLDIYNGNATATASNKFTNSPNELYKQTPSISANGALVPPPYRDPPPPRNSPLQQQLNGPGSSNNVSSASSIQSSNSNALYSNHPQQTSQYQSNDYDFVDYQQISDLVLPATSMDESESIFQATQYNDLLQLIKFQREKINQQQMELTKYDAEIVYLESKERDQAQELEAISREITKADQLFRQGSEQLQTLQYVEEENELVKQQEKTLKSEIALLRSKLANCETELLQCKNKIRLLMDDIEIEQRTNSKQNMRQNVERDFLIEMERIQSEIDQAIHNTDTSNKTAESLKKEILLIENAIQEKKRQVEQLVNEMKEVNLQSLTVTTSEEIKHLLEGSNKPGSSRRIIGSPRQLENAVPTSKNPHGVWV